jgi:mRNA interferase RelE/StbE
VAQYSVEIRTSAIKELEAVVPKRERQRIARRIAALADEPRPRGCEKLTAEGDRYRVRQGRYRIVYAIDDPGLLVDVVKIGHRKEIYR